jgi:hypothetical protein
MQRFFRQYQQRAAKRQIVAFDEPDKAERHDQGDVVGAEWDAVEL